MGTALASANLVAQSADLVPPDGWAGDPPTISSLVEFAEGESNLRTAVIRYVQDKAGIERRYPVLYSPVRMARLREFHNGWNLQLQALDFESLNYEGQIDYIVLRNRIDYNLEMLTLDDQRAQDLAPFIPFFDDVRALEETRLDRKRANPREAGATLDHIARTATELADNLRVEANKAGGLVSRADLSKVAATRAANQLEHLREILSTFNAFYDGFDPLYTFWAGNAHEAADAAMQTYARRSARICCRRKTRRTPRRPLATLLSPKAFAPIWPSK